jgi:WD40 repeat protein
VVQRRERCQFDPGGEALRQLAFSSNGRMLAGLSKNRLHLWHLNQGTVEKSLWHWYTQAQTVTWFPSGDRLAVVHGSSLVLTEPTRLHILGVWPLPAGQLTAGAVTPDGRMLVLGGTHGETVWWDSERQQAAWGSRWHGRRVCRLAFSADGSSLAMAASDGQVLWMDARPPRHCERLAPALDPGPALPLHLDGILADRARWRPGYAPASLAFSSDGSVLAAGGSRPGLLFDTDTLQIRNRLEQALQQTGQVAFIPKSASDRSGQLLTVGPADEGLVLWNASRAKACRPFPREQWNWPYCLVVSPDGRLAAVGHHSGVIEVWDLATATFVTMVQGGEAPCLAFSPDGRTLASGAENRLVKFWDVTTLSALGAPVAQLGLNSPVRAVSFAPDGRHFLTSDDDKGVQVWSRETGKGVAAQSSSLPHACTPDYLMWSMDGRSLLGVEPWGAIYCWNFQERTLIWSCGGWPPVTAATWSGDGKRLALGRPGQLVEEWDLSARELRRPAGQGLPGPVRGVVFTPDGRGLVTACALGLRQIRSNGLAMPGLPFRIPGLHDHRLRERTTDAIRAWDLTSGKERDTAPLPDRMTFAPPSVAALSPDGLVLACGGEDGRIDLLDYLSGSSKARVFVSEQAQRYAPVPELAPAGLFSPRYPEGVRSLTFSPSGRWLAALGTQGQVRIWETTSWKEHWTMAKTSTEITWAAFAADDRLVTSQGSELGWWDVAGRKLDHTRNDHGTTSMSCGAFDSSGRWLATGMAAGGIQLLDLKSGKRKPLLGYRERVTALAFAPDGSTLASGSWDKTVRLWDTAGREVGILEGTHGRIWSLAFSPDGSILAAGGEGPAGSGDVVLWRTDR